MNLRNNQNDGMRTLTWETSGALEGFGKARSAPEGVLETPMDLRQDICSLGRAPRDFSHEPLGAPREFWERLEGSGCDRANAPSTRR